MRVSSTQNINTPESTEASRCAKLFSNTTWINIVVPQSLLRIMSEQHFYNSLMFIIIQYGNLQIVFATSASSCSHNVLKLDALLHLSIVFSLSCHIISIPDSVGTLVLFCATIAQ